MDSAWGTLHTFSQNHKQLQGSPEIAASLQGTWRAEQLFALK